MQLRENARPMNDEEFKAWMERQEDIKWAMRGDGRPDSSPGLVAWMAAAAVIVLLGLAWVLS
jgi:hypothetical protein